MPREILSLVPGQTHWLYAPAGLLMQVDAGALRLDGPPQWLAETVHMPRRHLDTGQRLQLREAGWIGLSSQGPARVVCTTTPTWAQGFWQWCQRNLRRWQLEHG